MLRQTPAKGSPLLKIARRISPGWGASGLERAKSRVRFPLGSRTEMCAFWASARALGKARRTERGGGYVFMWWREAVRGDEPEVIEDG